MKYTVIQSIEKKISICLNRGRAELVGNDDVSIVFARKYEMVRMTLNTNLGIRERRAN